ncbi:hypothetical protein Ahy_A05g023121 [Arachis hypogaea]|uniref:DNA mismatch repair protein MutS-like N-terminal domain-containing protein n=1 Tax=Arachis hypogaea TaxID=3818 RepID=A0A445D2H0_ARAHY|nr:hypothetical protein Ahy_A05g023121 [Arachis hypogaea]
MFCYKVGKFYEFYEMDAEIGHKELDWKITLSGVGKCRQLNSFVVYSRLVITFLLVYLLKIKESCYYLLLLVGISESGIDDAVQNLVARGYKVGRVEQLETSVLEEPTL